MQDNSVGKLGGTAAILVGVSYIVVGIAYFLQPPELQAGGIGNPFWTTLAQNPTAHVILQWALALGGILALAAIPAISMLVRSASEGWLRWAAALAYLGFAVVAISNFRAVALERSWAADYAAGDASTQAAIATLGTAGLDPQGWLVFGGVGLWLLVVSLLALRGDTLPLILAYLGIATTVAYWLVVAGLVLGVALLVAIGAGLGGIVLAPIWYIWMGVRVRAASS